MNLDHLAIFVDLVETLNFRKTAYRKNISQPAVSQAISSIENEIGVQLFQRSRSGVKLTAKGKIFYNSIKPMLNTYYKSVQEIQQTQNEKATLTIGLTNSPYEAIFVPKVISKFITKYPDIKVFLQNYDHNQLKRQLLNHDCDLILTTKDDIQELKSVNFTPILQGFFCALVPKNNPLTQKNELTSNDFDNQSIILMDNNWCPPEQLRIQEIIRKEAHVKDIAYVNNIHTSDIMCRCGLGMTICPSFICGPENESVKPIKLQKSTTLSYGVATLTQNNEATIKNFVKIFKSFLAET